MTRHLSAKAARAVINVAVLEKAPDHRDTHRWHVTSGGTLLAVIEPAHRAGTRNGWRWRLADSTTWSSRTERTRETAAAAALGTWQRQATNREGR